MKREELKVLIDRETIQKRVAEMGREIGEYYADKTDSIVAICVLKGSIHFFSELVLNIPLNVMYSFVHVSSYVGSSSTGRIRVNSWIDVPVSNEYVLLVEDIVDTGNTIRYIMKYLQRYKP
ncbi:MAG: hypoxanthine phosphoribosyltransferase, partial [Thermotogota bacterium]|nr:hypoxanthine phosphoribosyltransferase [Thermotogota bacterium]